MADGTERGEPVRRDPLAEIDQWVVDHHQAVFRYAYRLTGNAADAEDLTQQTFLVAQQKGQQVRQSESVRGWLMTVLRHAYLKTCRPRYPLPLASFDFDVNQLPAPVGDHPIDGEQLQAALDGLSDEFRTVLLMYYFEERAYREIAAELAIPLGTVMSRLARAKASLRRVLGSEEELASVPVVAADAAKSLSAMSPHWTAEKLGSSGARAAD